MECKCKDAGSHKWFNPNCPVHGFNRKGPSIDKVIEDEMKRMFPECPNCKRLRSEVERLGKELEQANKRALESSQIGKELFVKLEEMTTRADQAERERDELRKMLRQSCDDMRAEGGYEGIGICLELREQDKALAAARAEIAVIDRALELACIDADRRVSYFITQAKREVEG